MCIKVALLGTGTRLLQGVLRGYSGSAAGIGDFHINLHGAQPLGMLS